MKKTVLFVLTLALTVLFLNRCKQVPKDDIGKEPLPEKRVCFEPLMPLQPALKAARTPSNLRSFKVNAEPMMGLSLFAIEPEASDPEALLYLKTCSGKKCYDGVVYDSVTSIDPRITTAAEVSLQACFWSQDAASCQGESVTPMFAPKANLCCSEPMEQAFPNHPVLKEDQEQRRNLVRYLELFQEGQRTLFELQTLAAGLANQAKDDSAKQWFQAFAQLQSDLPRLALSPEFQTLRTQVEAKLNSTEPSGLQLVDDKKFCADKAELERLAKRTPRLELTASNHKDLDLFALLSLGSMSMENGFQTAAVTMPGIKWWRDVGVAYGMELAYEVNSNSDGSNWHARKRSGARKWIKGGLAVLAIAAISGLTYFLIDNYALAGEESAPLEQFRSKAQSFGKTYDEIQVLREKLKA